MRKFIVLSIVLLVLAGFAIISSAEEVKTLYADQTLLVGTLTVKVVGDNLEVTYEITEPWVLGETHLYVGESVPKKSAPGRFPFGPEDVVDNKVVYTIPLVDLDVVAGDTLVIAAHAEVTNPDEIDPVTELPPREETAWANGTQIRSGKNWATYFTFVVPAVVVVP